MRRRIVNRAGWMPLVWLLLGSAGQAQDWARQMFDHTSHDFGVVARGAKVEHAFTIENIYEEDAHILPPQSSCGCTTPRLSKDFLKTWDKAEVLAVIDTRSFLGRKDATIKVKFDKPFEAEVQLQVHCFIRQDVVVQPGVVQFGSVPQGTAMRQKVTVSYAGRADWRIDKVEAVSPCLSGEAVETSRTADRVTYDLWVTLKNDAPVGYLQDNLVLVTNDFAAQSARVPVPIEGIVVTPAVTARPSPLMLGLVEVKQAVTRPLVVQGKTPFRILGAQCNDPHFNFKLNVPTASTTLQVIPVTFTGDAAPGKVSGVIRIDTDQGAGKPLEVTVQVQVVPIQLVVPERSGT